MILHELGEVELNVLDCQTRRMSVSLGLGESLWHLDPITEAKKKGPRKGPADPERKNDIREEVGEREGRCSEHVRDLESRWNRKVPRCEWGTTKGPGQERLNAILVDHAVLQGRYQERGANSWWSGMPESQSTLAPGTSLKSNAPLHDCRSYSGAGQRNYSLSSHLRPRTIVGEARTRVPLRATRLVVVVGLWDMMLLLRSASSCSASVSPGALSCP
ncbi:hypothetical protein HD554DRAFT_1597450 [Boletus coccyginus]|nr:hypothetical protein HD554DRAFT_1597450 [Boletus coccyginus]